MDEGLYKKLPGSTNVQESMHSQYYMCGATNQSNNSKGHSLKYGEEEQWKKVAGLYGTTKPSRGKRSKGAGVNNRRPPDTTEKQKTIELPKKYQPYLHWGTKNVKSTFNEACEIVHHHVLEKKWQEDNQFGSLTHWFENVTLEEKESTKLISTPTDPRYVHAAVIVNNNLYVMGGGDSNDQASKDFFSLDLSQTFDTTTPPWKDLTETSPLPVFASWAKASSNTNNDTIFLFGGRMYDTVTGEYNLKSVVYTDDFKSNQWLVNLPAFQGTAPETRRGFASVSDPLTGKLYIHGGVNDMNVTTGIFFNDFFILDGNNLSWSKIGKTGLNIPPPRIDHAAVLIANGVIVFIGGRDYSITTKDLIALILGI
ncbi:8949_t:CDS:2 [Entrophospora sp. SA101]|nr:8949_t:CDS:2 [Entrophospora sp. SA101]